MRKITDKDYGGLLAALRVFIGHLSGERLPRKKGLELLERAFERNGNTADEIFNKENWGRALALDPALSAESYIDGLALDGRQTEVKPLGAEPDTDGTSGGLMLVAEAVHAFYMEITGRGGKWSIPSALQNVATAIERYGLQAILSEEVILRVNGSHKDSVTCYAYIASLLENPDLVKDEEETEAQSARREEEANLAEAAEAALAAVPQLTGENPDEDFEYADYVDPDETGDGPAGDATAFVVKESPQDVKLRWVKSAIENYTVADLTSLMGTMKVDKALTFSEMVYRLANGMFNPAVENEAARNVHMGLNADLLQPFIDCVRMQGIEMDAEIAERYDILYDSWDLRCDEMRRLHKVKALIFTYGEDDPDLLQAAKDIEAMYLEATGN